MNILSFFLKVFSIKIYKTLNFRQIEINNDLIVIEEEDNFFQDDDDKNINFLLINFLDVLVKADEINAFSEKNSGKSIDEIVIIIFFIFNAFLKI